MSTQNNTLPSVLITGCSSGHGEALAKLFVRAGYPTYASARKLESIEGLKKMGANWLFRSDHASDFGVMVPL